MIRCLFCRRKIATALCPNCGALEMSVWNPNDDERDSRDGETELERLLKKSIERAKEMRRCNPNR
jgi:hypothetical protein